MYHIKWISNKFRPLGLNVCTVTVLQSGNTHGSHAEIQFLHSCRSFQVVNYSLCPSTVEMSQERTATEKTNTVSQIAYGCWICPILLQFM